MRLKKGNLRPPPLERLAVGGGVVAFAGRIAKLCFSADAVKMIQETHHGHKKKDRISDDENL